MSEKFASFSENFLMSKTAVVIDLDYTLIDGAEIKRRIFDLVAEDKVPLKVILRRYEASKRSGLFVPRRFVGKSPGFYSLFRKAKAYNYPGAERFLKILRANHDLHLITYGERKFQLLKIRQSRLGKLFRTIRVTSDPTKKAVLTKFKGGKYKAIAVLDDSPAVIRAARMLGFFGLRVKKIGKTPAYYSRLAARVNRVLGGATK
jgi:FMN phosphatase YigB (HAD superfamily)